MSNSPTGPSVENRISKAINTMPYGGMVHRTLNFNELGDLEALAAYLEALNLVLHRVASDADQVKRERDHLVQQRAAVREFLGTSGTDT